MLILCVYALWERSRLIGGGIVIWVVSCMTTAIILRDKKLVSDPLDIIMC
jgi:hypothetical protein